MVEIWYKEDDPNGDGHKGRFVLAVRKDTASQLAGTDGDYAPFITDANGKLHTTGGDVADSIYIDDADWTDGTSKHMLVGGLYGSNTITSGDVGPIALAADGAVHIDDGGNSITIDGTVTAELSSVDNTVLDNIDTSLNNIETDAAAIETLLTGIDADTDAIKTDAAAIETLLTAANVDHAANEALLTTIDADTSAIKTAVETLDNAVSGNEFQVDVVAALPAGSNAIGKLAANDDAVYIGDIKFGESLPAGSATIGSVTLAAGSAAFGKLAANSGVDIGDVDVTSVVPGTGATNLGKAEDAAHTSGDVGVMGLAVRDDTPVEQGADGDYVALQADDMGRLRIAPQHSTDVWHYYDIGTASETKADLKAADSGNVHMLTDVVLTGTGSVGDDFVVLIEDGSDKKLTVALSIAATGMYNQTSVHLQTPIAFTAGTAISVTKTCTLTGTGAFTLTATGYTIHV